MAEWKKIVVSGSAISQLNNDSGYLKNTGTIASASTAVLAQTASVALRANTLAPTATATSASTAVLAQTASVALRANSLAPTVTAASASTAILAQTASVAVRATTLSADATASIADRATTASFADTAGTSRLADSASVAARATLLSADATASFADLASDARTATSASIATTAGTASVAGRANSLAPTVTAASASVAARATTLSADATASFADLASSARAADSASVATRATTLSAAATASFADLAGTVHDGNITNAKIAAGTIANDRLVNDSVTLGATEVELGATATTLQGLDLISATTGTFVLQVFESSSTVITSGSNIFGNDALDIQQITGSMKQSGSFTLSGSLKQSHGTISGSFEGDGSQLTGLATTLTVDGDSGTQNVSLTDDDLQIIGTANELETAVTKVGTDVKVTLGLPNTVAVTASVATRANSLAPTVTASQADSATTASHAVTATSASAIIAGAAFPTTQGLEGQGLALNASKDFIFGDFFGTGSTKKLNQSVAASTWSFEHNLNEVYPIIQAYDSTGDQLIPARIESIDANNVKLYFTSNTAGVAAAMVGGMGISASQATSADTASVALRANSLAPTVTAASASVAARATLLSNLATASFADLASDARTATSASIATTAQTASVAGRANSLAPTVTATSASVAARATTLSAEATASFADVATLSRAGSGSFSGSFQGDGSDLTGIATTLTVDGDSGTQNVDLQADDLQIIGTSEEIETAVTKVGTDVKVTVGLPNNVTIANDLTVTNNATIAGDLVVDGSIVSASSLAVEDQFIILASGSNGAIDGGIIVNQVDDHPDGKGVAFAYDSSANRWALETGLNDSASVITPDAYMGVIQESAGAPGSNPTYGGTSGKGTIFVDTSADEAYIYV